MDSKKKNRGGRPTKYKPEYCDALIEHMAKGYSFETFGASVGVWTSSTYLWLKHPKFSEAKKEGEARCRLWWEKLGMGGASGHLKNFNAAAWIFNMKNRFHWKDRIESTGHLTVSPHEYLVGLIAKKQELSEEDE